MKLDVEYDTYPWGPWCIESKISQEFIDILLEKGNEARAQNNDHRKRLAGQIENEYYYKDYMEWFCPLLDPYVGAYVNGALEQGTVMFEAPIKGFTMLGLWINYQRVREYNPPHAHGGDLSFVIYLQVPDEIAEENIEERYEHNNPGPGMIQFLLGPSMPLSVQSVGFMPKVGGIVIFPAWLPHYVNDFKSDVERISVSGNLNFMYHDLPPINVETGRPELGLDD